MSDDLTEQMRNPPEPRARENLAGPYAADQLALAHARMTPAEIAANAIELAEALEMTSTVLTQSHEALKACNLLIEQLDQNVVGLHREIQRAQSLSARHRKAEARELIARIAAIEVRPVQFPAAAELAALEAPAFDYLFSGGVKA